MTVIFACTFPNGAAIAADTLLHDPETNERVMNAKKILNIGYSASVAQAGSFNGTEDVWKRLEEMPLNSTPTTIAKAIHRYAAPVYRAKIASGNAVMRYLVAGLEEDGTPAIRWLEFDKDNFGGVIGPGQIAAIGTLSNTQDIAKQAIVESLKIGSNTVMLDKWCSIVVGSEAAATPQAVGFPSFIVLMKGSEGVGKMIGPDSLPEPEYEVYWP